MIILYPPPTGHVVACMHIVNSTIKPTYAHMVWSRSTKFGKETIMGSFFCTVESFSCL